MPRNKLTFKDSEQKRDKILIISDGLTEINYIKGYIETTRTFKNTFEIQYIPNKSNTRSVYNYIKATHFNYEYIFALTDKDGDNHKKDIYNSFCIASNTFSNLVSGYTNPCFEVWLFFHTNFQVSFLGRKDLKKIFEKKINKKYKSDPNIFNYFEKNIETAINNSSKINAYWNNETKHTTFCKRNPNSNIHKVINKIKELDN